MRLVDARPVAVNEFLGLGCLEDWVPVAEYRRSLAGKEGGGPDDGPEARECHEMVSLVRARPPCEQLPGPDHDFHTAVVVSDYHGHTGLFGLFFTLAQLLEELQTKSPKELLQPVGLPSHYVLTP